MEKKESDVLIKVSGRNVIDHLPPIISFASQTLITFDTDRTDSYSGFNITYEVYINLHIPSHQLTTHSKRMSQNWCKDTQMS